ncbi:MAG: RHS repeat protein [Clostridia bacterium]|nr:RHS repeat protein [Clostridia bacterium]
MTNKQWERRLAQAMGTLRPETDFDTVAGAIPAPATEADAVIYRHSLRRYVAAVAAAAVMVTGVGVWWYTRPEDKPPVIPADTATTTTGSAADTTTTTVGTAGSTDATGSTSAIGSTSATTDGTVAPTKPTTKPTTPPVTPPKAPVTSLKEAKAAIADGRYEAAYLYLLTDNSKEAVELLEKFVYVPVGKTDTNNGTGSWTYDEMGLPEMESIVDESAGTKKQTKKIYTYDPQGRVKTKTLIAILDGKETKREEYTYTYDAAGYLVREDYSNPNVVLPSQYTKVYTYDERGNRIREELIGNTHVITTYTYDEANRLLLKLESYVEKDTWKKWEYVYDAAGRVLSDVYLNSHGSGWTYEYTYDENGVQTSYSHTLFDDPNHWQKWHMEGNQKVYEDSQGHTGNYSMYIEEDGKPVYSYSISYRYLTNKYGMLQEKGLVCESESFYDERGNLLTEIEWNDYHPDVDENDHGVYRLCTYDDKGNCVEKRQYTFTDRDDPEGSAGRVWITDTYVYVYDAAGRVLEYQYTNAQGKVSTHVYAYDAAGRIIKDGSYTKKGIFLGDEYTYDAAGRVLVYKKTYNTDYWRCVTYTYDEAGHKIGVEYTYSDGTWSKYTYDAAGNLLRKEDNEGVIYACTWELRYYPDGLTPEHRQELEEFRNATGGDEIFDDSGSDFEGGLVDA